MAGRSSHDSSGGSRRKSRFDDPNPPKRAGLNDSQHGPANPSTFNQGYGMETTYVDPNAVNSLKMNPNLQNPGFQPNFPPMNPGHPVYRSPPPGFPLPFPPIEPPHPFPVNQLTPPMYLNQFNGPNLGGKEDLDSCKVGRMASILMKIKKGVEFVPYKPIEDMNLIPEMDNSSPSVEVTLVRHNLVEDFYEELDEIFDLHKAEIDPNDVKFNYSRRRKFNLNKQLNQPVKIVTADEILNPAKRDYYPPEVYASTAPETSGLGSNDDLFESFRRKRSTKYHENYAIREAVRKDPNCIVISPNDLCYKCNKPGHYAKDCKYGIT